MATDYFSDHEALRAAPELPTPSDTPYMTPQPSLSRRSSRYDTPSSEGALSSPAQAPPDFASQDLPNEERISFLDPRRFTPTLHANLVAEILSLRRDLESKDRTIEDLESGLQSTRIENELLNDKLSTSLRESRSAKRQLQQVETGTLSALEELAKERDQVQQANSELRIKLEESEKKARSQENDSDRTQDLWQRDKETWDSDKRTLERRIHVTEARLKTVLEELAAQTVAAHDHIENEQDDISETSSIRSPSRPGSARTNSRAGRHGRNQSSSSMRSFTRGYRASILSFAGSEAQGKLSGFNLADELSFDEEDEDLEDLELDSDDFTENELRARRAMESRQSMLPDEKARKMLGLVTGSVPPSPTFYKPPPEREVSQSLDNTTLREQSIDTAVEPKAEPIVELPPKPEYVHTGVQFSPPPSPRFGPLAMAAARNSGHIIGAMDVEANQRKKRISQIPSELKESAIHRKSGLMVSTSSQTLGQPLSPPETPTIFVPQSPQTHAPPSTVMVSASTQTEIREEPKTYAETPRLEVPPSTRAPPPAPITVPSIAIHPPLSSPNSPRDIVLPPNTTSAACQTTPDLIVSMRSAEMQTEPIKIDTRLTKLPPHLLPSAISSKPGTTVKEESEEKSAAPAGLATPFREKGKTPLLPSTQELLKSMRSASNQPIESRYPGNNDNGPLAHDNTSSIRRPFRTSSLFAGFDDRRSDDDAASDEESSDDEYKPQATISQGRAVKYTRPFANPPTPVPEEKETRSRPSSARSSIERPARVEKPVRTGSHRKQPSIRRSALVQSGVTAHEQRSRSRSPSLGEGGSSKRSSSQKPPFPVPTRLSSRKIPFSKSEGSTSPTRTGNMFTNRRLNGGKQHSRQDSLRKVRSAAVVTKVRPRSRSPPLPALSPQTTHELPSLPSDQVRSPQQAYTSRRPGHRSHPSTSTAVTNSNSVGSSVQSVSVVDAIAATMVGEWMWKYVRGRKSFGVADAVPVEFGKDDGTGNMGGNALRHKRWVWISPYERSIMWSSKQPTSGTALLGKSGRKLTIQSVLDVKDDTPFPRGVGHQQIFNRSILILTPQRALKFTAVSAERHYLWLTSLSFLAHSSQAIPDIQSLPPAPTQESDQHRRPTAALGRAPIRNSVRLAKDRSPRSQQARSYKGAGTEPIYEHHPDEAVELNESASPPTVPRFSNHAQQHGRKRSLTNPRIAPPPIPPMSALRSFSHGHSGHPPPSFEAAVAADAMNNVNAPPSAPSSVYNPGSRRTSEASSGGAGRNHNFFDAVGTVRMEAFVSGGFAGLAGAGGVGGGGGGESYPGLALAPAPVVREKSSLRHGQGQQGRRRGTGNSGWSSGRQSAASQRTERSEGEWGMASPRSAVSDPFKGF